MAAQCLGALSSLDRQKMLQHASRYAIGHEGGKMRSQLVQLRCRPTMRWPVDARLGAAAASAAKSRQPHGRPTEQRRDLVKPPVLDVAFPAAGRAIWPQNRMLVGLRGDHRLLNTRQKLLCLGQRQPQIPDIAKVVGPADLQHVDTPCPAVGPRFDQLQNPPHPRSPSRQRPTGHTASVPIPPVFGHSPAVVSKLCFFPSLLGVTRVFAVPFWRHCHGGLDRARIAGHGNVRDASRSDAGACLLSPNHAAAA